MASVRKGSISVTLALVALAAVACSSAGGENSASTPTPFPTVPPTPTLQETPGGIATAEPVGDGGIPASLSDFLSEVDRRVSEIRGIPVADQVPYRFLGEEELDSYVRDQVSDEETVRDIEIADVLYTLLGLISPGDDLFEEYAALLDSQVLGAYDPEEEEFVVLQPGGEFGPSQEFTYAHEYVHRLQDSRYDLDAVRESLEDNGDRSLAFTALVEGDATTAQQLYAIRHMDFTQLARIVEDSRDLVNPSADTPYILRRGLEFPYVEGTTFVDRLRITQGPESLHTAFTDPPESSEQILHLEKYLADEQPLDVALPESVFAQGSGWEVVDTDVLGEFFLKAWLEGIGARSSDAADAAAGWGGDVMRLAKNAAGNHVMAAKITWDDPSRDPTEFQDTLTTVMAASPTFLRVDVGADVGVKVYRSDGGTIATAAFPDGTGGRFTAVAAGDSLEDTMAVLLQFAA